MSHNDIWSLQFAAQVSTSPTSHQNLHLRSSCQPTIGLASLMIDAVQEMPLPAITAWLQVTDKTCWQMVEALLDL